MNNKIHNKQASAMCSLGPVAQPSCVGMQNAERSVRNSYRLATCRAMPVTRSDTEL